MYYVSDDVMKKADINLILNRIGVNNVKKFIKEAKIKKMDDEQQRELFRKMVVNAKKNDYALGVVVSRVAYTLFYDKLLEEIKNRRFQ